MSWTCLKPLTNLWTCDLILDSRLSRFQSSNSRRSSLLLQLTRYYKKGVNRLLRIKLKTVRRQSLRMDPTGLTEAKMKTR